MTTITKEGVKAFIEQIESDLANGWEAQIFELKLARIALASLEAEPVAYIFKHPAGELFWSLTDESNKGQNDVMPVYAAQPVQETGVYKDILNIIGLLEKNEWAEHCTNTVLGSLLESEITRLVGKEQPAPVVPDEWTIQDAVKFCRETGRQDAGSAMEAWNACRAAMLQGSQPVSDRDELPCAQVKAVADLYALCWQSGEVVTYTPDSEKAAIWLNNYSGTCVQEYVKLE